MKFKCIYHLVIVTLFLWSSSPTLFGQSLINNVDIQSSTANLEMAGEQALSYKVEIAGPDNYYWLQKREDVQNISITRFDHKGELFKDGLYTLQITPVFTLTEEQRTALSALRKNNDEAAMIAFRTANNLPNQIDVFSLNFSILNGNFVTPQDEDLGENRLDMPEGYDMTTPNDFAPTNTLTANYPPQTMDRSFVQVFAEDVIVQGSLCVGIDCVSSESFGSDTQRLKENNLRIHFDDTSASASFPGNDWRLVANDQDNGGANFFSINDATAGTVPFRVDAGSGNHALYVSSSGGNVGMGTATPVVELQITDGDSPTIRLEQNGANGWTPQTWDVAGNETNFFVRDVTNGSKLPFKIKPNAPDNSIFIAADGDIGLGTQNPAQKLHASSVAPIIRLQNTNPAQLWDIGVMADSTNLIIADMTANTKPVTINAGAADNSLYIDAIGNVGIGTITPGNKLHVNGNMTVGGDIIVASDVRFKKDIEDMTTALPLIQQLQPKAYTYRSNEFKNTYLPAGKQYGFIAQDIEKLLPELVNLHSLQTDETGEKLAYKGLDYSNFVPLVVKAMQEQQTIIATQATEINTLKTELETMKAQLKMVTDFIEKQK